jgi:hypothetical protein
MRVLLTRSFPFALGSIGMILIGLPCFGMATKVNGIFHQDGAGKVGGLPPTGHA